MRVRIAVVILPFLFSLWCFGQERAINDSSAQKSVRSLMSNFEKSSFTQDAQEYSALFASNATWDGPFGQNAIGPKNIQSAVRQMFMHYGPLRLVQSTVRRLSPNVFAVDTFQAGQGLHDTHSVSVAPGSVGPPKNADVRTTYIIEDENGVWKIVEARIADLRLR